MTPYSISNPWIIAQNRFGYGALQSGDEPVNKDVKNWLKSGLTVPQFNPQLPSSNDVARQLHDFGVLKKTAKENKRELTKMEKSLPKDLQFRFLEDSFHQTLSSPNSVNWRLLDFFSNHFSVTSQNAVLRALAPTLEREAIAPYLFGQFEDMLIAVAQHPAMLIYLNNERSFGPNSIYGKRGKGLNENLAREILELHTLGVNGGYQQADVLALAKGITGWSVANLKKEPNPGFIFRDKGHEPRVQKLLGKTYSEQGIEQGKAMLRDLARHPATGRHICTKLAQHFIQDEPPSSLIDRLLSVWRQSSGNLHAVMVALIETEEAWLPSLRKYKSPRDWVFSVARLFNIRKEEGKPLSANRLYYVLKQLGQAPFNAGSPAGYPDTESAWLGASALMSRVDIASSAAARYKVNAESLLKVSLANTASELTYNSVLRAESRQQAAILLLLSPEFLRR